MPRGRIASSTRSHCRSSGDCGIQRRAISSRIAFSSERSHFAWHGEGSGRCASRFGRNRQNTGQIRSRNRPDRRRDGRNDFELSVLQLKAARAHSYQAAFAEVAGSNGITTTIDRGS